MSTCTQCSQTFTVTSDDLAFYEKISPSFNGNKYLIPEPTHCPPCREQRRMAVRNERKLYNRRCDLTQKQIISIYAPDSPITVYETSVWWSEQWDSLAYGKNFDFTRPFFEQFHELQKIVPRMALNSMQNENSDFTSFAGYNKNCYLIHTADRNTDCYYGVYALRNSTSVDFMFIYDCELCYEMRDAQKCYQVFWGSNVTNCYDSYFLEDCINCNNCIMCVGLRNKSYCFKNKTYTKEEFMKIKDRFLNNLSVKSAQYRDEFAHFRLTYPHQAVRIHNSENCTGDFIQHSHNLSQCFDISHADNCKYCSFIENCHDSYDWTFYSDHGELGYELASVATQVYHCLFSSNCWGRSSNLYYCDLCQFCQDCFGCVGLRNKQYCIFNKQYSKEEYEKVVAQIITHMQSTREWGEFFPMKYSPFTYNETVAAEYYPLSADTATQRGLQWREIENYNHYEGPKKMPPTDINQVTDEVCKDILTCHECSKNYRIIIQELDFYRRHQLPIPQLCFNCRHQRRVKSRNNRTLYQRECMKCQQSVLTTFSPSQPEIIYCESCYLKETY